MKKTLLFLVILVGSVALTAQTTTRIYINPGHGGWDSDDRYQPLPPYGLVEQ